MAFYQLIEKENTITFQLTKGNAIFHFIFFRIYPYLLIALGLGLMFLMAYESGPDKWLVLIGLLPIAIAIFMLLTHYPIQLEFTKEGIKRITKSSFRGTIESFYYSAQINSLAYLITFGRGGGLWLLAVLNEDKKVKLIQIPRLRLTKDQVIRDATKAAQLLGVELEEMK
jgi:hypothetical protein